MADYIRTTLRGDNRTFEGHATFLRDRLNRDVARSRWRNEELIIHIVAFRRGGPHQDDETIPGRPWVYEVANCQRTPDDKFVLNPHSQFTLKLVGRIKIESKDDMRKRGLPSPDWADAMAIAFAGRANAAPMNVESHAGESTRGI